MAQISEKKVRILIDARFAIGALGNGQSTYLNNLLRELSRLDTRNEYALVTSSGPTATALKLPGNFKFIRIRNLPHTIRECLPFKNLWWRGIVSLWARFIYKPDIVFSAINVGPLKYRTGQYIAVAHDLDYIDYPDLYTKANREKNTENTQRSTQAAKRIISISSATQQQILANYQYDALRMSVIYHGYDKKRFNKDQSEESLNAIRTKYALPNQFLFSIGSLSPKKNILKLFEALHKSKKEHGSAMPCVLAGAFSDATKASLIKQLQAFDIESDIIFLGYIPDEDLPLIYRIATAFVFPSIAEGFGLPLVEAMACGCPVITSNTSCMPEIVANAALTCDPLNSREIADNLYTLFHSTDLRTEYSNKGIKRASIFSWTKTAHETHHLFMQVCHEA